MQGTVSQNINLGPCSHFMKKKNECQENNFKKFPFFIIK